MSKHNDTMTALEKFYAKKSDELLEDSAETIEKTKRGVSAKAAEMITQANKLKLKAGLIEGKLLI